MEGGDAMAGSRRGASCSCSGAAVAVGRGEKEAPEEAGAVGTGEGRPSFFPPFHMIASVSSRVDDTGC